MSNDQKLPKIFIVPYRDRPTQRELFLAQMQKLLADETQPYEIYFAHQCDTRPFNRGAMKNLGFLAMKAKYPATYKDITFIFHDVDTWPSTKGLVSYDTVPGIVAHFYGYQFSLGGIFAIKGADFEKSAGFPNFWGWGLEDNVIQERCLKLGLKISREQFYGISDKRITRLFDGYNRVLSQRDSVVYKFESPDDMHSLKNISYTTASEKQHVFVINIANFDCAMNPNEQIFKNYDIRNGATIKIPQGFSRRVWSMNKLYT
jgi:hypothetical protein